MCGNKSMGPWGLRARTTGSLALDVRHPETTCRWNDFAIVRHVWRRKKAKTSHISRLFGCENHFATDADWMTHVFYRFATTVRSLLWFFLMPLFFSSSSSSELCLVFCRHRTQCGRLNSDAIFQFITRFDGEWNAQLSRPFESCELNKWTWVPTHGMIRKNKEKQAKQKGQRKTKVKWIWNFIASPNETNLIERLLFTIFIESTNCFCYLLASWLSGQCVCVATMRTRATCT